MVEYLFLKNKVTCLSHIVVLIITQHFAGGIGTLDTLHLLFCPVHGIEYIL